MITVRQRQTQGGRENGREGREGRREGGKKGRKGRGRREERREGGKEGREGGRILPFVTTDRVPEDDVVTKRIQDAMVFFVNQSDSRVGHARG